MKTAILILTTVFAGGAFAQQNDITFESVEVRPGILMVYGVGGFAGGNMAVLKGARHIAMIDDSMEPLAPDLLEHVLEVAGRSVDFLINTHVHGDHVGGNTLFAGEGTVVFAHENIRKRLLDEPEPAGGPAGIPIITFADGVNFYLDPLEARVMHVPAAHTDGDAMVHFPDANVIHAGDLVFHDLFPFIDLENGGSVEGYIAGQEKVLALADDFTRIIPGHGELTDRAGVQADLAMLRDSRDRVRGLLAQGMSEDEVVAANPLAEYHDQYSWGFITTERMTRTLARGLREGD